MRVDVVYIGDKKSIYIGDKKSIMSTIFENVPK
jgi:hypothetical protein